MRHGGLWKEIAKRVISSRRIIEDDHLALLTAEINNVKNDQLRYGGWSPSQWVIGKNPRRPGANCFDEDMFADLGVIGAKLDADSAMALQQA